MNPKLAIFAYKYRYVLIIGTLVFALFIAVFVWGRKSVKRRKALKLPTGGLGIPTDGGITWSPVSDVTRMYKALHGYTWLNPFTWGDDEAAVFDILEGKTSDQLAAIVNEYDNRYQIDLIEDFRKNLGGKDLERALGYFTFL